MIPGSIVLSRFSHDLVGIGKHQDAPELSDIKQNTALSADFQSNKEDDTPKVRDHRGAQSNAKNILDHQRITN